MIVRSRWNYIIFVVFLIACKEKKAKPSLEARPSGGRGNMPVSAEGFIVKTKSLSETIDVPGTLFPYEETEIRSEISGRVTRLNIPEGGFVRRGTVLVKLFDGDLQAQLNKLRVQLKISQNTSERYRELLKINGISQQEYDLSQLQVNNLNADIEMVRVSIGKTEIKAPYDGRIGLRNISAGAYVTPADIITTISRVNQLKLEFTVPEKYSEMMTRGKIVRFTIQGVKHAFTANILATESSIAANTRSLKVRAIVRGTDPALVPGAFAKVSLQMGQDDKALIIPTQAVIPQARNKRVVVYRGGTAEFEVVVTGIRDSSFVQITEGLNEGDTVVTTGLLAIRPDSKITLTKVQ